MNIGHVQGGTNAGWRLVKQAHKEWFCGCFIAHPNGLSAGTMKKLNPGYRGKCDDCGERRPK